DALPIWRRLSRSSMRWRCASRCSSRTSQGRRESVTVRLLSPAAWVRERAYGADVTVGGRSSSPPLPPILAWRHPARRAHVLVEAAERAEPRLLGDLGDRHRR